jgi:hypothetical protein
MDLSTGGFAGAERPDAVQARWAHPLQRIWKDYEMDDVSASIARVAVCIRDRTSDYFERGAGVPIRERLDGVAVTAGAGESVVSLEILCSNLDEFDVPLLASEYALVQEAGHALKLPETIWTDLPRLVE